MTDDRKQDIYYGYLDSHSQYSFGGWLENEGYPSEMIDGILEWYSFYG